MKLLLNIVFLLPLSFLSIAQTIYLQNTYRGGVSVDGRSYYGTDFGNADTINFKNTVPLGSTIKKAFLMSNHYLFSSPTLKDNNLPIIYNGTPLIMDSSNIVSSYYSCGGAKIDVIIKDVSSYTLLNNNELITPNQNNLMANDPSRHYIYYGFLLVVLYENNSMPVTNTCVCLNSGNHANPTTYSFTNINPVNASSDIGLSTWVNDIGPISDSLGFTITSTLGSSYLGAVYPLLPYGNENTLPGSFYYQNNTLFGLQDDINTPFIHCTDAIVNIKNYLQNNTTNFTLETNNSITCLLNNFILAYSTTCPARSNKDTTLIYNICRGSNAVTLSVSSNTANTTYSWYSADGSLSTSTTPSVIVTPTVTTNYIAYVDSAGCKHTEHFKVSVYNLPQIDSIYTSNIICGNNNILGTATIIAHNGTKPYQYNMGSMNQTSPTFTNIPVGTYTASVTDSMGCKSAQKNFIITQINIAQVNFTPQPDTGCAPATVYFNNTGNTNFNEWYVNGDSLNVQNLNYTFTDTGTYSIKLIGWRNLRMCSDTILKTVHIKDCPPDSIRITVPNIFSPNADDINDSWQFIISSYQYTVSNYQCTIYDRWGIKVFETNNLSQAWDGRSTSGLACSTGVYFYVIKLTATSSKGFANQKNFKGYLELVR